MNLFHTFAVHRTKIKCPRVYILILITGVFFKFGVKNTSTWYTFFLKCKYSRSSDHRAHDSRRVRFPPKMIKIRIECRLGERSLVFLSCLVGGVPECEGGWNGEWVNGEERVGPKRVRLEGESRKFKPRSRGADLYPWRKVRGEPNAWVRSQILRPDFVVHRGPEERPGLQRRRPPRNDQGQGDRKHF
jgi:hypothetical protein